MENHPSLIPISCMNCGKKTIGEAKIKEGVVVIQCPKCGHRNTVEVKPKPENAKSISR